MNDSLKTFGDKAKSLSRNPLGIIALFIVLVYGFASIVTAFGSSLTSSERLPLIYFLVLFPVLVLGVFGWLVSRHASKLYAPKDYGSDESFLKSMADARAAQNDRLSDLASDIDSLLQDRLASPSVAARLSAVKDDDMIAALREEASQLSADIRQSAFLTIDLSAVSPRKEPLTIPFAAFPELGAVTNQVYFAIEDFVRPYTYGHEWVLRDAKTNKLIKNLRMLRNIAPGAPYEDTRSLEDVGIHPGMTLKVELLNGKQKRNA